MANYKLYVRNKYFNRVAEIDDYTKLEITARFNAVGAWVLEMPTNCDAANEIIQPGAGIIVVRNGQILLSGPANVRTRKWDISNDNLTISGFDDNIWLQRFLAYPVPSGPPYTSTDYDVRTGPAETVMKQYVDVNMGANAQSNRQLNITNEADKGLGSTVTGRARFQTLLDLFSTISISGGDLGFKIIQVNNDLQFQVFRPTDKTRSAVFSPLLGNLLDFEYSDSDPSENYIIAGGTGEGTARMFVEKGDYSTISNYGRYEYFLDKRDTSDINEMMQAVDSELAQKSNQTSLSITPVDTDGVAFGTDYNLGDKVSVVLTQPKQIVDEQTIYYFISMLQTETENSKTFRTIQDKLTVIQDVVRELKITINRDGELISPFIGTPDSLAHPILGIFSKMKKIDKRVKNLERR